jgi:hypothetical protein
MARSKGCPRNSPERSADGSHTDFSDLGLLGARDAAELQTRERFLQVVETYTRAFFDRNLSGMRELLLDDLAPGGLVVNIERFKPSTSPCIK